MIIGVPKEIKTGERRVSMTPQGVEALVVHHHRVLVEKGAGVGSGFSDREYLKAGAILVDKKKEAWAEAEMIVKVKEPLEQEFTLMKPGQVLFTYLPWPRTGILLLDSSNVESLGSGMRRFKRKMDPFPSSDR